MKRFIIALVALTLCILPAFAMADADNSTITTTGYASVTAVPDQAKVVFGIEVIEPDAQAAQASVNTVISAATEAIRALGIDEANIKTQSINIYREYDYSGETRKELGFNASTTLTININDITLTGSVIDAGLENGLNTINTVSFSTSRESEYYAEALSQATKNAVSKANILANAADVEIESVARITEGYSSSIYTTTSRSAAMFDYAVEEDAEVGMSAKNTAISAGELTISAQVEATFNIK